MAPTPGMETCAARLASFNNVIAVSKRRGSNVKGHKSISWPHRTPSPNELAEAGLYYDPSVSSPDNTTCFLCESQLAGWEEDDEPAVEHFKWSSNCGWAIIKNIGKEAEDIATMQDPTSDKMFEARKSTFESRWPHENKRGWTCKTETMAAAGWHFAPTPECEDFVSCAYCNLSLDGWEPKDSPFDEHYRRSPGCAFFTFAGSTAPKKAQGKKQRLSKASRLSTSTIASQAPSIPDLNDSIDISNLSQDTRLSTSSTMTNKKGTKGKGRSTRAKKAEVETSTVAPEEEVSTKLEALSRGAKRKSEQISEDHRGERESTVTPESQPKRRATRSRTSAAEQVEYPTLQVFDIAGPAKEARVGRKRASSRARKVSTASVATTASLRATIPDDAEIEAALEADLDKAMPDLPPAGPDAPEVPVPPKTRGRAKKTKASTAPTRSTRQATAESEDAYSQAGALEEALPEPAIEVEEKAPTKVKAKKGRGTKKAASKKATRPARDSIESNTSLATNAESQINSSVLSAATVVVDSGNETDASVASQKSIARKGSKRKGNAKGKGRKGGLASKNIEDVVQTRPVAQLVVEIGSAAQPDPSRVVQGHKASKVEAASEEIEEEEPKRVTRAKKGGAAKANTVAKAKTKVPQLSMPGMFSPLIADTDPSFNSILVPSSPPTVPMTRSPLGADQRIPLSIRRQAPPNAGPEPEPKDCPSTPRTIKPPVLRQNQPATTPTKCQQKAAPGLTPPLSPQSSDAENQPPSSRPASVRPPLAPLSPSIHRLLPTTPRQVSHSLALSPSKIGGLVSEIPWTAVDVEMIFARSPDKENSRSGFAGVPGLLARGRALASPEKGMTVEEWIKAQAEGAEEELRAEAERVVSVFEREGGRALRVLEGVDVE